VLTLVAVLGARRSWSQHCGASTSARARDEGCGSVIGEHQPRVRKPKAARGGHRAAVDAGKTPPEDDDLGNLPKGSPKRRRR